MAIELINAINETLYGAVCRQAIRRDWQLSNILYNKIYTYVCDEYIKDVDVNIKTEF